GPRRRPLQQGVHAAADARLRSDQGLLEEGAAGRGLGLPHGSANPHSRLTRQQAAPQTRPRARPLRDQLLGSRLQADRRMTESAQLAAAWVTAGGASLLAVLLSLRDGRRRSAINEAIHELRRPLQAMVLASGGGERVAAARESSVRLASSALERLDREVNGGV